MVQRVFSEEISPSAKLVTYNLRDFAPAKRFGIPVLTPEKTIKHFDLAISRK